MEVKDALEPSALTPEVLEEGELSQAELEAEVGGLTSIRNANCSGHGMLNSVVTIEANLDL